MDPALSEPPRRRLLFFVPRGEAGRPSTSAQAKVLDGAVPGWHKACWSKANPFATRHGPDTRKSVKPPSPWISRGGLLISGLAQKQYREISVDRNTATET